MDTIEEKTSEQTRCAKQSSKRVLSTLCRMGEGLAVSVLALLLLASFTGGYAAGNHSAGKPRPTIQGGEVIGKNAALPAYLSKDVQFSLLWDVWQHVKQDYVVKDTPDTKLFYGALAGVVESLGDPYSSFFDPDTAKRFNDDLSGSFSGIGAEIGVKNNQLLIIAPLPGTPAEKAGLRAGDKILMIDKKSTTAMTVDVAVDLIRGKRGTQVMLTIYRDGEKQERKVTITRDTIKVVSVKWEMKANNVGYIQITHFNRDTEENFKKAVDELMAKKAKKIILDLRNDPGGFLDTAVTVAGYWTNGKTVVIEKEDDEHKTDYKPDNRAVLKDFPTVVLVNGGSASASEIVAGALQDYGEAKIVGTQTFGKGSVQNVINLSDGSELKLTIAKWYTPKDRSIHEIGIAPDVKVEITDKDIEAKKDPQLEKAMELLK